jgi:hypothetical protein
VPGRSDIAFAEYNNVVEAEIAKNALDCYVMDGNEISVDFATR